MKSDAPVHHFWLLGKIGRGIDETGQFDHPDQAVQVAATRCLYLCQQADCAGAGCCGALFGCQAVTDLAGNKAIRI